MKKSLWIWAVGAAVILLGIIITQCTGPDGAEPPAEAALAAKVDTVFVQLPPEVYTNIELVPVEYLICEVHRKDTLSKIAALYYGDAEQWPLIATTNNIAAGPNDKIYPYQVLRILIVDAAPGLEGWAVRTTKTMEGGED